jgi:GAF domain-containing protein
MTISTRDLHRALQELGELRFGETDVNEAMHRIVHTTHAIFDVDGAGLMLVDADQTLRNAAVSDDRLDRLETLQLEHDEGPCITAFDEKTLVCAEDLAGETRWPDFCPAARAAGLSAILASPIPYNQSAIGVVAVLSEDARPWSPEAELALMAFTDLAALMIASILHGERQTELAGQLQGALNSRQVIEQAKGILMGTQGVSARAAYEQLRARSRTERRKIPVVCAEVVRDAVRHS